MKWFYFSYRVSDTVYDEYYPIHQITKIEYDNKDEYIDIILKTGHRIHGEIYKEDKEKIICFLSSNDMIFSLKNLEKESIIDMNYLEDGHDLNFVRTGAL